MLFDVLDVRLCQVGKVKFCADSYLFAADFRIVFAFIVNVFEFDFVILP